MSITQGHNKIGVKSDNIDTTICLELKLFEILFCCWKTWGVPKLILKPSLRLRKPYWLLVSNFHFFFFFFGAKFQGFISIDCGKRWRLHWRGNWNSLQSDKDLIDTGMVKTVSPDSPKDNCYTTQDYHIYCYMLSNLYVKISELTTSLHFINFFHDNSILTLQLPCSCSSTIKALECVCI